MLISVQGISKRFGPNPVLRNVSFSVLDGEVLGLIGPNGAGKTTLFECLAGLIHADAGDVKFRDNSVSGSRRKEALFYLPDAIRPWADQRLNWVLGFFGKLYARSKNEVADIASALGLEALMVKRALLAIGLLTRHELLLLDEPFDGLDLRQTRDVMSLFQKQAAGGRTLFLSIHQLVDASRVCHRAVLLSAGTVVGEGTLEELKAKAGLSEGGLEEVFLALT